MNLFSMSTSALQVMGSYWNFEGNTIVLHEGWFYLKYKYDSVITQKADFCDSFIFAIKCNKLYV